MDLPSSLPPPEIALGLIMIFFTGLVLGAAICLPIVHKNSDIPLEKLSGDWIWKYTPDLVLSIVGCVITIIVSFILIGGFWHT